MLLASRMQAVSVWSCPKSCSSIHHSILTSKAASPPYQTLIYLILPYFYDPSQHPPIKSANPWLASSPLVSISSISSKLFFPQKSLTPLTNRLLIFSTSGSSTAAKQILKYAQLCLSLISSVGANMDPGATSTRYSFEVKWTHSPCASLAGVILFQRGWEGKLRWILTGISSKHYAAVLKTRGTDHTNMPPSGHTKSKRVTLSTTLHSWSMLLRRPDLTSSFPSSKTEHMVCILRS